MDIADARLAATDLNWLINAEPINRAMLLGSDTPPTEKEIDDWADHAARTFLAAYRPNRRAPAHRPPGARRR